VRAAGVLVGRAPEITQLAGALAAARVGDAHAVLVTGEAGIGKSRLVSEVAARAAATGFVVLTGRAIDLVGSELPYAPFASALRPLVPESRRPPWATAGSPLLVFEDIVALLSERAASTPVMLVLEDLHWADATTVDLTVYLANNLTGTRVLLVGTCRTDHAAGERRYRLEEGIRRGGGITIALRPLTADDIAHLVASRTGRPVPAVVATAIATRSEGNPFFAEELLASSDVSGRELPLSLRELLLRTVERLGPQTQALLRVVATAGRDADPSLLRDTAALSVDQTRRALREAVDHEVLVVDRDSGRFRFRHALLADAIYATVLPGELEETHTRLAEALRTRGDATAAELAPHWAAAGRPAEALSASMAAAREAQAVFGLAEAHAHLERAIVLWHRVPDSRERPDTDLSSVCAWAAELASLVGAAPRAVELARMAIDLIPADEPHRAGLVRVRLGQYLHEAGHTDAALRALTKAVDVVPAEPPSPELASCLASLAGGLVTAWRYAESREVATEAVRLSLQVGTDEATVRGRTALGCDLAYLGDSDQGLRELHLAIELAEATGDRVGLHRAYVHLTDCLTMLGRPTEAARTAKQALVLLRGYGIHSSVLLSNRIEALLIIGHWDAADTESAAALRSITGSFPYMLLMNRADLEMGRGDLEAARTHLDLARATLREDHGLGVYEVYQAELALWQRTWKDAVLLVNDALVRAPGLERAQLRVWFCAKGLRALAELAALCSARRDARGVRAWRQDADRLLTIADDAARQSAPVTPNAAAWHALARAEHQRVHNEARPESWEDAAQRWDDVGRIPSAIYCRWRQAEELVTSGADRARVMVPLRQAYAEATRLRAQPLIQEIENLARRARIDPATPTRPSPAPPEPSWGLTPREGQILALLVRGHTDREIAEQLTLSPRTVNVHVAHILRKLNAANRHEAAKTARRLTPPG
jgi:DNA-binding CsgD family transcriptional regulator/tetratricopeptide (TPR) repeat protein